MTAPTKATIKRLFALSGNRCAFPKCTNTLVDRIAGGVTGEICHIKAQAPGGPRFDAEQSNDERHAFANLILLCVPHHQVIDADEESYTVERLVRMKAIHEASGEDAGELPEPLAEALILSSTFNVSGGSAVASSAQAGGQTAHLITNIFSASAPHHAPSFSRDAAMLTELWESFQEAAGAVGTIAGPLQYFDDPGKLQPWQFDEWLTKAELLEYQKAELRVLRPTERTAYIAKIDFARKLSIADQKRVAFHNLLVKKRILLPTEIKDAFAEADDLMSEVVQNLAIASDGGEPSLRRDAYRRFGELSKKVPVLENAIAKHLRGTA